jgi:hypothetical protein
MSHELVRALRAVYDDIDGSDTGQPSRAAIATIPTSLQSRPDVLKVIALWSAARALVLPQVEPRAVDPCTRGVAAIRQHSPAAGHVIPSDVDALLQPAPVQAPTGEPYRQAQICLGRALAYSVAPEPARFMQVIDALIVAQRSEFARPRRAKQAWIGWLDDVAARSDRFTVPQILQLLERALRGTLDNLPPELEWEGTANDKGELTVWAKDPRTDRLLTAVMRAEPLKLMGRTLVVTVLVEPRRVSDPLRIEYFAEQVIHRRFLGEMYAGQYDVIEYRCLGTGEIWQAPA